MSDCPWHFWLQKANWPDNSLCPQTTDTHSRSMLPEAFNQIGMHTGAGRWYYFRVVRVSPAWICSTSTVRYLLRYLLLQWPF